MTQEQVKYRLATINEAINDMVDANVAWDRKEVENFDWDYFYAHLDTHISKLQYLIGVDDTMVFLQSLINSTPEDQPEDEYDQYREELDLIAFENSL